MRGSALGSAATCLAEQGRWWVTLEKRAQRTDRKHANPSEGLHTQASFGQEAHSGTADFANYRTVGIREVCDGYLK